MIDFGALTQKNQDAFFRCSRCFLVGSVSGWQLADFAALAAEEWGIVNSKYDWSTGAYQQVFHVRPEWQGKVVTEFKLRASCPLPMIQRMQSVLFMSM